MTETQTLEEAWADMEQWCMEGQDDLRDAARALALAVLEIASSEWPQLPTRLPALRRRIEELGR